MFLFVKRGPVSSAGRPWKDEGSRLPAAVIA